MDTDISSAKIEKIIVHKVGNKLREEGCKFSIKEVDRTKALDDLLLRHYLSPITQKGELSEFYHESDIGLNTVYHYSELIFSNPDNFIDYSEKISKHLYSASIHPNIQQGELIFILFNDIISENAKTKAIGIYKVENKDSYFDVIYEGNSISLKEKEGISLNEIQKGALILQKDIDLFVIDSISNKTRYWNENFLKVSTKSTPQTQAKIAVELIKNVSSKLSFGADKLRYTNVIQDFLSNTEKLSINKVKDISQEFIEQEEVNTLFNNVLSNSNLSNSNLSIYDDDIQVNEIKKQIKNFVNKINLYEGLTLKISNNKAKISKTEIIKTSSGIRAIIDIDLTEDKK